MTAPKHALGRAERLVDFLVVGIEHGIARMPAPALGIAIGLFLGWVINIVATAGPVEYMSPLEAEAMNYDGGPSLLPERASIDRHAAGKAYTACLKEAGGRHPDGIQIPGGATIARASSGRTGCDSTLVYPPEDY